MTPTEIVKRALLEELERQRGLLDALRPDDGYSVMIVVKLPPRPVAPRERPVLSVQRER